MTRHAHHPIPVEPVTWRSLRRETVRAALVLVLILALMALTIAVGSRS